MIGVVELGGDKQLLALDAAAPNGLAHAALIAVSRRSIDVAVPRLQSRQRGGYGRIPIRRLPGAKADAGNLHAVCQRIGIR